MGAVVEVCVTGRRPPWLAACWLVFVAEWLHWVHLRQMGCWAPQLSHSTLKHKKPGSSNGNPTGKLWSRCGQEPATKHTSACGCW